MKTHSNLPENTVILKQRNRLNMQNFEKKHTKKKQKTPNLYAHPHEVHLGGMSLYCVFDLE